MSHPSITASAAAMMRLYDSSPPTAVNEWRNALQVCREDQLLPLLYVANEVLQNSKRNRGNKFLEAFGAVLGQSLEFICSRIPPLTEKVRRTAKIWGDRRVFSVRFVGELISRLEPYRNQTGDPRNNRTSVQPEEEEEEAPANFSPGTEDQPEEPQSPQQQPEESEEEEDRSASPTADDLMRLSSDDESIDFGGGDAQLDIQVDASQLPDEEGGDIQKSKQLKKRRRSSTNKKRRRTQILSTQTLQDLVSQLASLEQSFDQSTTLIQGIPLINGAAVDDDSELVGEELVEAYQKNQSYSRVLEQEKANLYKIANQKRAFEQEALRYIPWTRSALLQDEEDLQVCDVVEQQLMDLMVIHGPAKKAREIRQEKARQAKILQERQAQLEREEEERKQLLAAAMARQDEAKPGMVWDKRRQEYVYLNTEESWRD